MKKIGFGGGCHWCTEATFQSLKGVEKVEQGWMGSAAPDDALSEAVIVHYHPAVIPLEVLIGIHLHTHAATKNHSFREKYRSAVYVFDGEMETTKKLIAGYQVDFDEPIITKALLFKQFKRNTVAFQNYYKKHKEGAFCDRYIHPKLRMIESEYAAYFKEI